MATGYSSPDVTSTSGDSCSESSNSSIYTSYDSEDTAGEYIEEDDGSRPKKFFLVKISGGHEEVAYVHIYHVYYTHTIWSRVLSIAFLS